MDPRDTKFVEQFDESLKMWTDSRMVSAEDIRVMTMFIMYVVNLADHQGWKYRGHSWKESEYLGCLVVKAVVDDIPQVVFTNAKTTIGGMRIFLKKLDLDILEWVPDKYA